MVIKSFITRLCSPVASEIVRVTPKTPDELYSTCGFCSVEELGEPPSNSQLQPVGLPSDSSVKKTVNGGHPVVTSALKAGINGERIITVFSIVFVPHSLVADNDTVYSPG